MLLSSLDEGAGERASAPSQDDGFVFRGIHFNDWLTLAMEVCALILQSVGIILNMLYSMLLC